jgi:hypothetical protein
MSGGGAHIHLGIIMTHIEYSAISVTPWAEPYNPGAIPIIAAVTNTVDAAWISRLHDEFRHIHTNHTNVDQTLKRIILEAYDNMYTSQLEDYLLQYANCAALEISMHLKQTYVFINQTQLAENYNKTATIKFQYPIETLFKKIEDGVRYANPGMQQYTEAQYVNISFILILNTCAVPGACIDWQSLTPVNQTWADFRLKFAQAQHEQRIISGTASGAGYHTANVAEHYVQSQLPDDGGFVTSMANLSTATSANRDQVDTLTKAIVTLTDQLASTYIWAKYNKS